MNIEAYHEIRKELDYSKVALVAVSKTKPIEDIQTLYDAGHRIFGENRAREIVAKHPQLPQDIQWHMIGHLQRNKVKLIASLVQMIESVDSIRLLNTIQKEATAADRCIDVLLQLKIAREESKYGFSKEALVTYLESTDLRKYENVRFRGVMGMASFVDDQVQVRREFALLKGIYDELSSTVFQDAPAFDSISMGMSGDYRLAIEEGSTMVRIGSLIFGSRD